MPRTRWHLPKQGLLSQTGKDTAVITGYDSKPLGATESPPIFNLFSGYKAEKCRREKGDKNWDGFQGGY